MAFNFGAFIGGASENLVEMIKTKEAQMYKEDQDEKEIKRRARMAAVTQRRADEKEAREIAEGLSLFYTKEQVGDILSKGKTAGGYALKYAQTMSEKGYDPSAGYSMPKAEVQSELAFDIDDPRGSQISPQMAAIESGEVEAKVAQSEGAPFVSRFTAPPTEKDVTKAKTYEARLVELDSMRTNATDPAKRENLDAVYQQTLDQYKQFKSSLDGDGTDSGTLDFSKQSRDSFVDNEIQRTFELEGLAEKDITGKIKLVQTGNEANAFALRYRAHRNLVTQYGDTKDTTFKTMIANVKNSTDASVEAYKQSVYRSHLGAARAASDNDASISGADASSARKFKALPSEGRTREQVQQEASEGMFKQNDVVAYTDEQGNTKLALISDLGVLY
jgi:hypothetical protein